jgi:hypothetical protein
MRKILARDFAVELISLVALIIAISLAWLGHVLALSTPIVITASIGVSLAANIWALKWWIRREIHDTLTLYKILESIEDPELYDRGMTAIEECRIELENLSQGLLRIDPIHLNRHLIEITDSAKHQVRVTHVGLDDDHMELIQPISENQWYQHNVNLVQRGILLERVLILPRSETLDKTSSKIKTAIADILNAQVRNGIKVYLVWEEVIDPELIQEFIIIDAKLVMSGFRAWSGTAYTEMKLSRRRYDVAKYIELFDSLIAHAHPIPELAEADPSTSSEPLNSGPLGSQKQDN